MNDYLQRSGYQLDAASAVWTPGSATPFAYNDGDEVENRLLRILQGVKDLALASDDLREHETDWASTYHLSPRRVHLLMPFAEALKGKKVLEIGSGCGAITRYLGELGCEVLALEGGARRAHITRTRTRDLPNVHVLNESFAQFSGQSGFDVITLIGVLEYSALFTDGEQPAISMLKRAASLLKPEGTLYVAIENQMGIKYWAGIPEDHLGVAMVGLENKYSSKGVRTWGRKTLLEQQRQAGFENVQVYCPFPDYKFPVTVIPAAAFETAPELSQRLAKEALLQDPQIHQQPLFNLRDVWTSAQAQGLAADLSNSFLLICKQNAFDKQEQARAQTVYHYAGNRISPLRRQKLFVIEEGGEVRVNSLPQHMTKFTPFLRVPLSPPTLGLGELRQKFGTETYQPKATLQVAFHAVLTRANWAMADLNDVCLRYWQALSTLSEAHPSEGATLSGALFDAIPRNIVLNSSGPALIDDEWGLSEPLALGYVFWRGILTAFWDLPTFGPSQEIARTSYHALIGKVFASIAPSLSWDADLYLRYESVIQNAVTGIEPLATYVRKYYGPIPTDFPFLAPDAAGRKIASLQAHLDQSQQLTTQQQAKLQQLELSLQQASAELHRLHLAVHAVHQSSSWKWTQPLRRVVNASLLVRRAIQDFRTDRADGKGSLHLLRKKTQTAIALIRNQRVDAPTPVRSPTPQSTDAERFPLPPQAAYQHWTQHHEAQLQRSLNAGTDLAPAALAMAKPLITHAVIVADQGVDALEATLASLGPVIAMGGEIVLLITSQAPAQTKQKAYQLHAQHPCIACLDLGHCPSPPSDPSQALLLEQLIAMAHGTYLGYCHAGDLYSPAALEILYACLQTSRPSQDPTPPYTLVYADHDYLCAQGQRHTPWFKTDWDPYLFQEQNYLIAATLTHTATLRAEMDKSWFQLAKKNAAADLVIDIWFHAIHLQLTQNIAAQRICHLPIVLQHCSALSPSDTPALTTQKSNSAQTLAALEIGHHSAHIPAPQLACGWMYLLPDPAPHVTLIVPTRNQHDLLKTCVESILEKTAYSAYDILVVDNGSDDAPTLEYLERIQRQHAHVSVLHDPSPFNYSAINNRAVQHAKGDIVGLVNNDIEAINPHWLTEMVSLVVREDVGCVGAKLYYPNDTIQHAGVVMGQGGIAGHVHSLFPRAHPGYQQRLMHRQSYSAVTAAVLLVRKAVYQQAGGLDAVNLGIGYNDIDFCMRVKELGYTNLWTPYAELYHHESASRGKEDSPEKLARFNQERNYMLARWADQLQRDPAYNVNLSLEHTNLTYATAVRKTSGPLIS
jgi:GT2 family glycosyltransferase/2-polyprenyl-3-methyl-5-hydroxy-6-metoxy-1,4-benzoquinol methylase